MKVGNPDYKSQCKNGIIDMFDFNDFIMITGEYLMVGQRKLLKVKMK